MKNSNTVHIGIDDTDSKYGMCTTYLAYELVRLLRKEVDFLDYPKLIRLNPNIPWKTRGNGSISIKIKTTNFGRLKTRIINLVMGLADIENGANPGLVFYYNDVIPNRLINFSQSALFKLISRNKIKQFLESNDVDYFSSGNSQGLIGATSAIGYQFNDHTFELITYRKKSKIGGVRKISLDNVKLIQKKYATIFNSYYKNRILITPHGPDPVFYGIRGEDVKSLICASKLIQTNEHPKGYMVFKSNQGTSSHLDNQIDTSKFEPYASGTITGHISTIPIVNKGGHVTFFITNNSYTVKCISYRQTRLMNILMHLLVGDLVSVGGGIRKASKKHERVLNLELLKILKLVKHVKLANPKCKICNKNMKSEGHDQGFECRKCKTKQTHKIIINVQRSIKCGTYIPIPNAHRHLTRPLQRLGVINKNIYFDNTIPWFHTF
ncbi:MAG: tRNA(Ile)(2)-agmatinylcytidine synthase [Thaumarchaeota archaeon]|nr:tRNA(Ile)(2)-agmatinylcytidine synthase [Nitrososphaerota archaeon]